jgi:hypothetical protein
MLQRWQLRQACLFARTIRLNDQVQALQLLQRHHSFQIAFAALRQLQLLQLCGQS